MSAPNTRVQSGPANDSKWTFRRHWTVDTTTGPVVGHAENGVTAFRGIPYAEPPVGNLRFRRARPITPWKEPFIAFHSGDKCVQVKNPKQGVIGSENCLWLDVIVPTAGHPSATCSEAHSRPVVAFFHGGSNCFGSAANPQYSAQYLACSLDAVVVVVNYRIGLLGAMSLGYGDVPGGSSHDRFDTNIQLSDAILALHWIHDNAAAFGGNPEKLTMMGQSSGGGIVTALTAVPGRDKIVSKAIAMSAAPATMVHHPSTSGEWANRLFELYKDPVSASAQEIGRLTHKLNTLGNGFIKYFGPFSPVLDGDLLSRHPLDLSVANSALVSSGRTQPQSETKDVRNRNEEGDARTDAGGKIPLLIGTTKNEYYYLQLESVSTSTQRKRTKFFAESLSNEALDVLKESYRNVKSRRDIARFWGDSIFWAPSVRLAERWLPKTYGCIAWIQLLPSNERQQWEPSTHGISRFFLGDMTSVSVPRLYPLVGFSRLKPLPKICRIGGVILSMTVIQGLNLMEHRGQLTFSTEIRKSLLRIPIESFGRRGAKLILILSEKRR